MPPAASRPVIGEAGPEELQNILNKSVLSIKILTSLLSHCALVAMEKQSRQPLWPDTPGRQHTGPTWAGCQSARGLPSCALCLPERHLNWALPTSGGTELTRTLRPREGQWRG